MGIEELRRLAEPVRRKLAIGLILIQIGLSIAFFATEACWLLPVFSDTRLGREPWFNVIALGSFNCGTTFAAIGFIICLRSLNRLWSEILRGLAWIVVAGCIASYSTCPISRSPLAACFVFLFLCWILQCCFLGLLLRGLRPLSNWDLDEQLLKFVEESAADIKAALSRWRAVIRRVSRQDLAWIVRRLEVVVCGLICFDLCVLGGLYLVDRLVYPTFFGVIPTYQLVFTVIGAPFIFAGGLCFASAVGIACGMGFVLLVLLTIVFQDSLKQTIRLRRDLIWTGLEPATLPTASL
jgi:hypothetical protein